MVSTMFLMLNREAFDRIYLFCCAFYSLLAKMFRTYFHLKARGMSIFWLFISFVYLVYLHGACVVYIISIASRNFLLVRVFARRNYSSFLLWIFNIFSLSCNCVYILNIEHHWAYLDTIWGSFIWRICFNLVILRMISFGYDYHWQIKIHVLIMRLAAILKRIRILFGISDSIHCRPNYKLQ